MSQLQATTTSTDATSSTNTASTASTVPISYEFHPGEIGERIESLLKQLATIDEDPKDNFKALVINWKK
jgi:hypothetical protein